MDTCCKVRLPGELPTIFECKTELQQSDAQSLVQSSLVMGGERYTKPKINENNRNVVCYCRRYYSTPI